MFMENWDYIPGQPEGWPYPVSGPPFIIGHIDMSHYEKLEGLQLASGQFSCYACGKSVNNLLEHLNSSDKPCKKFYDVEELQVEAGGGKDHRDL